jgi:hypothetical protein
MMKKLVLRVGYLVAVLAIVGVGFTSAEFRKELYVGNNSFSTGIWAQGKATITEVLYNPAGVDAGQEWIEITNTGNDTLDMTGYLLHFDRTLADYVFPEFTLPEGGVVVIHVKAEGEDSGSDLYWPDTGGRNMNNNGSVSLFNRATKSAKWMVDYVEFGAMEQDHENMAVNAGIWPDNEFVPQVAEGSSIELINKTDNNQISDWQEQPSPNPGV